LPQLAYVESVTSRASNTVSNEAADEVTRQRDDEVTSGGDTLGSLATWVVCLAGSEI